MIVGIDLGTTNSLVGIVERGKGVRLFPGSDGGKLIPSVVHFPKSGVPVVGAAAREILADRSESTLFSVKRFIGRGKSDVTHWLKLLPFDFSPSDEHTVRFQVGERILTPVEVSAIILNELKRRAESALGQKVTQAVVTVPAYFNDAQRQATKLAGQVAGLEVLRILNEPTAACLAYGLDKKTLGNIVVFDLGGGTFDISILRVKDGVFEVLATNGDTALGGDDFDHAIAQALSVEIQKALGKDPLESPVSRTRLVLAAEALKRALSDADDASFSYHDEAKTFERLVSRQELEQWIAPILAKVEDPCRRCLEDAKLKPEQISDVILVGGSTRTPLVRAAAKRLFRRDPISTLNPDEVVAMGAAVQANLLSGQGGDLLLLDVIPLSLGIETMGGVVSRIIHRNSTIPTAASETFSTYVDGQTAVAIHVVQGERELVKDNRSLARFELRGLPPLPAGVPKIEVEFVIDANGILSVRAMELRTGQTASVVVNPTYGLDDAEVEKMLMSAFDQAESDFETRFLVEARTEADGLIRAVHKSLERGRDILLEGERERIEKCVLELEKRLNSADRKPIREGIDNLNAATQSLAERLLNRAVQDALTGKSIDKGETP